MNYYKSYNESVEKLVQISPKKGLTDSGWNKHLPVPVTAGYPVYVHPDQSEVKDNYIKVIHGEEKAISTFLKSHFDNI